MTAVGRLSTAGQQIVVTAVAKRWRWIALAVYVGLNLGLLPHLRFGADNLDWSLWVSLPDLLARGELYATEGAVPFVWAPVAGYVMAAVSLLGYWPWVALHVAFVFLLRDWRLIGLMLISFPFWVDAALGNVLTFQVVTGMLALRSKPWSIAFLLLAVLVPRPVVLPLVLWLLWKRPDLRLPLVGLAAAIGLHTLASGYAVEWITAALNYGRSSVVAEYTIGPTALVGSAWLLVGVPLGAWLTWRGWPGVAGLAVSPYLFPYYLLMPLVDLVAQQRSKDAALRLHR